MAFSGVLSSSGGGGACHEVAVVRKRPSTSTQPHTRHDSTTTAASGAGAHSQPETALPAPNLSLVCKWSDLLLRGELFNRSFHAAAEVNGRVHVFGGEVKSSNPDGSTTKEMRRDFLMYDCVTEEWVQFELHGDGGPEARKGHTLTAVGDKIVLFGGVSDNFKNDLWIFDTKESTWTRVQKHANDVWPPPRAYHTAAFDEEDSMWIFGGFGVKEDPRTIWKLNLVDLYWEEMLTIECPRMTPTCRYGHASTVYRGYLLVFGGQNSRQLYSAAVYILDLETLKWQVERIPGAPATRTYHAAARFQDRWIIHGGSSWDKTFNDVHELSISTLSWRQCPSMATPEKIEGHTLVFSEWPISIGTSSVLYAIIFGGAPAYTQRVQREACCQCLHFVLHADIDSPLLEHYYVHPAMVALLKSALQQKAELEAEEAERKANAHNESKPEGDDSATRTKMMHLETRNDELQLEVDQLTERLELMMREKQDTDNRLQLTLENTLTSRESANETVAQLSKKKRELEKQIRELQKHREKKSSTSEELEVLRHQVKTRTEQLQTMKDRFRTLKERHKLVVAARKACSEQKAVLYKCVMKVKSRFQIALAEAKCDNSSNHCSILTECSQQHGFIVESLRKYDQLVKDFEKVKKEQTKTVTTNLPTEPKNDEDGETNDTEEISTVNT